MTARKLIQIVEWDIERCSLTYGSSPCTAVLGTTGDNKCWNCIANCQDLDNFTTSTETLRFAMNVDGLPRDERIYPCMSAPVSTNPAQINLGGVSNKTGPLGKRARVTIKLQDFTDSDIWFDRYQSERISGAAQSSAVGYDPATRSTFFAKLRKRFPYYLGREIRVLEGEVGQALSAMRTRHYIVSDWSGPNAAGEVTITAKDILDLADNNKALCPKPSSGSIAVDIADTGTPTFDIEPAGIGDDDYPASGRAAIGSEIVSYTRSSDTITITGRALDGSSASSHSAGDTFQECFRVEGEKLHVIARDILRDYAGVDASYIPFSDWADEGNRWLPGVSLTTTISSPTGVTTLMGELARFGVIWWWDDVNQEIVMRTNRPLDYDETAPSLSDNKSFIEGSLNVTDMPDELLTSVVFLHGQIDSTDGVSDGNFSIASVAENLVAAGDDRYGQDRIMTIKSRWLGSGDSSIASTVAQRILNRYENVPQKFTFSYDVKDVANVTPAKPIEITSRLLVDETGDSVPVQMQITSVEEKIPGHTLQASAQTYVYGEGRRYSFITENTRPVYGSSSDAEKAVGLYWIDENDTEFADGGAPYVWY